MEEEYFVGIDLHRQYFTCYATNGKGDEILKERLSNCQEAVDYLVKHFPFPPKVVIEATRNWMWLVRALREKGCQVSLAHPLKTKAIASARIKTDLLDAKTLSHLLRSNLVPSSYVASEEEQDNRELARGRIALVHYQTMIKNRIRAILGKENLSYSGSDLFGKGGRAWLKKQQLPETKRKMVKIYLERLDDLISAIRKVDELIQEKSSRLSEVKLLTSIPGVGTTTAFLLAAEIGDIKRFNTAKQFASYFGLVPRLHQSGNHQYYGRITKLGNPYVRWALVQTAHRLARMDRNYKWFVDRISYRGGKKKAIVALARKLATIIFCILKEKREYIIKDYQSNYQRVGRLKVCPAILPERTRKNLVALV